MAILRPKSVCAKRGVAQRDSEQPSDSAAIPKEARPFANLHLGLLDAPWRLVREDRRETLDAYARTQARMGHCIALLRDAARSTRAGSPILKVRSE